MGEQTSCVRGAGEGGLLARGQGTAREGVLDWSDFFFLCLVVKRAGIEGVRASLRVEGGVRASLREWEIRAEGGG